MSFEIIEGWRPPGVLTLSRGYLQYCPITAEPEGFFSLPKVERVKITSVELLDWDVEYHQSFSGAMVTGALGGALFGLPGIVAGTMLGGHSIEEEVRFRCELENGRSFTAIADEETYESVENAVFGENEATYYSLI